MYIELCFKGQHIEKLLDGKDYHYSLFKSLLLK